MNKKPHSIRRKPLWLLAALLGFNLFFPVTAGANGEDQEVFDWVREDGTEDLSRAPEFVHLADANGDEVLCPDGAPARVPYNWDQLNIPVVNMNGTEKYANMVEASEAIERKVVSGELRQGRDPDGGEWLQLTEAEAFRPDVPTLCSRY